MPERPPTPGLAPALPAVHRRVATPEPCARGLPGPCFDSCAAPPCSSPLWASSLPRARRRQPKGLSQAPEKPALPALYLRQQPARSPPHPLGPPLEQAAHEGPREPPRCEGAQKWVPWGARRCGRRRSGGGRATRTRHPRPWAHPRGAAGGTAGRRLGGEAPARRAARVCCSSPRTRGRKGTPPRGPTLSPQSGRGCLHPPRGGRAREELLRWAMRGDRGVGADRKGSQSTQRERGGRPAREQERVVGRHGETAVPPLLATRSLCTRARATSRGLRQGHWRQIWEAGEGRREKGLQSFRAEAPQALIA